MNRTCRNLLFALIVAGSSTLTQAADVWEQPAFSAEAAAVLKAATLVPPPPGADAEVIFEQQTFRFDEAGRQEHRQHRFFRCFSEAGVEQWSFTEGEWLPWCEERPEIRARVITADGAVHALDPQSISEAAAEQESANMWSDHKLLQAPLPAVAVGAVVEEEIVVRESRPFFKQGTVRTVPVTDAWPTRKLRLVIDAPASLPLKYEMRGQPLAVVRTEQGGRLRLVFEGGPLAVQRAAESYLPPDVPRSPELDFCTGRSWAEVAAAYAALIEPQIDVKEVQSLARETIGDETDRLAIAARLLAKVHSLVRYTGLELGEAAIVPRSPGETLARRYGDCKDQSALLAALLRAVDVRAEVALLRPGPGEDVRPGLPGLCAFDHAIVYVPGARPLWIDPTARFIPVGELPIDDQGRWALVAGRKTEGLVRTPVADYHANVSRETIELFPAEGKHGRVRETIAPGGSVAEALRDSYSAKTPEELRKSWRGYAKDTYKTRTVAKLDYSPPADLAQPFGVTAEIEAATLGQADDGEAVVTLSPAPLFDRLPSLFRKPEPPDDDRDAAAPSDASAEDEPTAAPRRGPLVLPEPCVSIREYRVTPPPGYTLRELPTDSRTAVGPATLRRQFARDGQIVVVRLEFDTGPGGFTAEEVEALRRLLRELGGGDVEDWQIKLAFDHVAAGQLAAGRFKEALAAYRVLLDREPKRAELRMRYAKALLAAGLGESARREARLAVELSPQSSSLRAELARVLTHDLLGRQFRAGMDGYGAAAAYRRAIELDGGNKTAQVDCAVLLEYGAAGMRYAPTAALGQALVRYRKFTPQDLDRFGMAMNLPLLLLYQEKYAELQKYVGPLKPAQTWRPLELAAVALLDGPPAAVRKAIRTIRDPDDRREILLGAAAHLDNARRYREAEALLAAVPVAPDDAPGRAALRAVQGLHRFEQQRLPAGDPRRVVQDLLHGVLAAAPGDELRKCFPAAARESDVERLLAGLRGAFGRLLESARRDQRPPPRIADAVCRFTWTADRGPQGARVRVAGAPPSAETFYVVAEDHEYRVLGSPAQPAAVARTAIDCLDRGQAPAAAAWLDGVWHDTASAGTSSDPLTGTPFGRLWPLVKDSSPSALRTAAAVLLAQEGRADESAAILEQARRTAAGDAAIQIDRALVRAHGAADRPADQLAAAERLLKRLPTAGEAWAEKATALERLGRRAELRALLTSQTGGLDPQSERRLAGLEAGGGDFPAAQTRLRRLIDKHHDSPAVEGDLAWIAVCRGQVTDDTLEQALHGLEPSRPGTPELLCTLAAVSAELGRPAEALEYLGQSLDARDDRIGDADRYVLGRVAEQYGLPDDAADWYGRVQPSKYPRATEPYALAKRRLAPR